MAHETINENPEALKMGVQGPTPDVVEVLETTEAEAAIAKAELADSLVIDNPAEADAEAEATIRDFAKRYGGDEAAGSPWERYCQSVWFGVHRDLGSAGDMYDGDGSGDLAA